jgi:hypothetical protein
VGKAHAGKFLRNIPETDNFVVLTVGLVVDIHSFGETGHTIRYLGGHNDDGDAYESIHFVDGPTATSLTFYLSQLYRSLGAQSQHATNVNVSQQGRYAVVTVMVSVF